MIDTITLDQLKECAEGLEGRIVAHHKSFNSDYDPCGCVYATTAVSLAEPESKIALEYLLFRDALARVYDSPFFKKVKEQYGGLDETRRIMYLQWAKRPHRSITVNCANKEENKKVWEILDPLYPELENSLHRVSQHVPKGFVVFDAQVPAEDGYYADCFVSNANFSYKLMHKRP